MIATFRLEAIGDNHNAHGGLARRDLRVVLRQMARVPAEQRLAVLTPGRRPWVARITGLDSRHGLAREFLRPLKDYRDANSTGSRGVWLTFVLRAGALYEVHELLSWQRDRRYFCHVEAGKLVELTREQVLAQLAVGADAVQRVLDAVAGSRL